MLWISTLLPTANEMKRLEIGPLENEGTFVTDSKEMAELRKEQCEEVSSVPKTKAIITCLDHHDRDGSNEIQSLCYITINESVTDAVKDTVTDSEG